MHKSNLRYLVLATVALFFNNPLSFSQTTSSPKELPAATKSASGKGKASLLVESQDTASNNSKKIKASPVGTGVNPTSNGSTAELNSGLPKKKEPAPAAMQNLRKVERKELTATPSTQGGQEYVLKYKFEPGQIIHSEVIHLAKTDTKIDSTDQNSSSRTVSHKTWEVTHVENGLMTFEYKINDIDMSQRIGEDNEIRYSSKDNAEPPRQFQAAADSIGKLISTVTIDEQGMIIARSDDANPPNLGMGDITLPVPSVSVAVGATWEIPRELRIRRDDGSLKAVRFRELFRFDKVSAGVATIAVRSEMLTAISDPKEEAQVLQQLSNGTIRFDIDAGRMISKELAWDKTVVGFSGAGSLMDYSARLDENVVSTESTKPAKTAANKANSNSTK
jgi:hypothetical protein